MKARIVIALAVSLFAISCTENKLTIVNRVEETINFNFRGEETIIQPLTQQVLTGIPNGSFEYSTGWNLQTGDPKQIQEGSNLSGELTFQKSSSEILIIYKYTSRIDSIGYTLGATVSTSDPVRAIVSP